MANLKEIRTRLGSVKTTRQITSAMKMVSAAKLRKAQDAIIQMRPYANTLQKILKDVSLNNEGEANDIYRKQREIGSVLLVVITSNKGLCGAFNANIAKRAISDIMEIYSALYQSGKLDILCIGKKGAEILKSKGIKASQFHHELLEKLEYQAVRSVAVDIIDKYLSGNYDQVKLYFNQFKNAGTQLVTAEQYLPYLGITEEGAEKENCDFIMEPSQEDIIKDLIPKSLRVQLYKALLDSVASEHGARMTAMHKATDNASELIKSLQLEYNKARQATITNEILEIVGGAEALKG
jgi:F-type H+-transporting ATPase subunit gamma